VQFFQTLGNLYYFDGHDPILFASIVETCKFKLLTVRARLYSVFVLSSSDSYALSVFHFCPAALSSTKRYRGSFPWYMGSHML